MFYYIPKPAVKNMIVHWITYVYFNIEAVIQLHAHDLVGQKICLCWQNLFKFDMLFLKRKLVMCSRSHWLPLSELSRVVTTLVLQFRYVKVVGNWRLNLDFKKIYGLWSQIKLALYFDAGQIRTTRCIIFSWQSFMKFSITNYPECFW